VTSSDGFDRPITPWLEDEAAMRAPDDLLPQVMLRAAHTRRRPGWATTGRWISMETRAQLGAVPRSVILLATLVLLTGLAAGAIALGAGSSSGPPPTGPAANGLIAYTSDGDIWVVNPDGSGRRQLTSGPADDHSPVWSRDGTRVAYWSVDPTGAPASIMVVGADGSDRLTIFTDEQGATSLPVDWSPDGERIAFVLCPADGRCGDFVVVQTDGTGAQTISDGAFEGEMMSWSPDGTMLAWGGRHGADERGVYVMTPDGSDVRRISGITSLEPPHFCCPRWSPDGASLVTHAGENGGEPDIWVIEADGSEETNLTEGPGSGFLPQVSPDGAWIAFRDGETVFLVPSTGGEIRVIGEGTDYYWSPDGTALALGGIGDLRIVDVVTGDTIARIEGVQAADSWQRLAP
jgi:Tol biopolymer transport system component